MGFELTREGSFAEFLGIKFTQEEDTIELTQTGLIDKIVAATNLTSCKPNKTPALQLALGSDPDGEPMSETWSYPSIIGMLLYLSTNTRPDIAFAVSQVARFSSNPKQTHATAVKMIVRYLKGTRLLGMIIRITGLLDMEGYVDADFAGLYNREPDHLPEAVKSRTGYMILLGGAPTLWKSALQGETALSTLMAEYCALSQLLRVLLPLKSLVVETIQALHLPSTVSASVKCTVFEDNMGAFYLATNQRLSPRTKHFLIKWHHFWEAVNKGEVTVVKIATDLQNADYLTKGLPLEVFTSNRYRVQGWVVSIDNSLWIAVGSSSIARRGLTSDERLASAEPVSRGRVVSWRTPAANVAVTAANGGPTAVTAARSDQLYVCAATDWQQTECRMDIDQMAEDTSYDVNQHAMTSYNQMMTSEHQKAS